MKTEIINLQICHKPYLWSSNKGVTSYPIVGKTITKSVYVTSGTTTAERMNMVDGDGDGDVDLIVGYIFNDNGLFTHFQEYFENTGSQFVYKPNYIEYDKTLYSELQVWSTDIDKDGLKDLYYPTYSKSRIGGPRSNSVLVEEYQTRFQNYEKL